MATRNTETSVRPTVSGPWVFCESIKLIDEFYFVKMIAA